MAPTSSGAAGSLRPHFARPSLLSSSGRRELMAAIYGVRAAEFFGWLGGSGARHARYYTGAFL